MSSEQIVATAAVAQAAFAFCLLIVVVIQAKIMKAQKELSQRIDQSGKAMAMLNERSSLSVSVKPFWDNLDRAHRRLHETHRIETDSIDTLIEKEGFPPVDPSEVERLSKAKADNILQIFEELRAKHKTEWGELWELAKNMCVKHHELLSKVDDRAFDEAWDGLARFWDRWSSSGLDIREYLEPDYKELVILAWLELALYFTTFLPERKRIPGRLDKKAFEFAKAEWERFAKERSN